MFRLFKYLYFLYVLTLYIHNGTSFLYFYHHFLNCYNYDLLTCLLPSCRKFRGYVVIRVQEFQVTFEVRLLNPSCYVCVFVRTPTHKYWEMVEDSLY